MVGFIHLIVEKENFTLLQGEDNLGLYSFNTHVAQHLFCKTCGVKSFYVPRSHPDGYSVNVNCLDHSTIKSITTEDFDGQNWKDNIGKIT
ncbi:MAG: GFA family protein [Emcibacter sp.]|nr:GFA family protein [Emcibacter sp.]